jgi:hypothetical protein
MSLYYPCMLSGEYYEGDRIAKGAEFVMEHPSEPSWGFYKLTNEAWDYTDLACFVNVDVEHAKENYKR